MLAGAVMLMLSDRAPGFLRRLSGDLAERIDSSGRPAQIATDDRLPDGDTLVHILVWAAVVVLVGWAVWSWRGLVIVSGTVFGASVVIELSQAHLTQTRESQWGDIVANAVGIVLGAAVVALCYLLWSAFRNATGRLSEPRSTSTAGDGR
jgi:hypothetical protein